jgi:hypothetical protein
MIGVDGSPLQGLPWLQFWYFSSQVMQPVLLPGPLAAQLVDVAILLKSCNLGWLKHARNPILRVSSLSQN